MLRRYILIYDWPNEHGIQRFFVFNRCLLNLVLIVLDVHNHDGSARYRVTDYAKRDVDRVHIEGCIDASC